MRQHRRAHRPLATEDRVRLGRNQLEDLAGDVLVLAGEALAGHDADAGLPAARSDDRLVPALAIRIVEADEAQGLDPCLEHAASISASAIRSSFCVVLNTQRRFASSGSTTDCVPTVAITGTLLSAMKWAGSPARWAWWTARSAHRCCSPDQLLDVLHRARRVAAVVELDVLDGRIADLRRQQRARCSSGECRWPK